MQLKKNYNPKNQFDSLIKAMGAAGINIDWFSLLRKDWVEL